MQEPLTTAGVPASHASAALTPPARLRLAKLIVDDQRSTRDRRPLKGRPPRDPSRREGRSCRRSPAPSVASPRKRTRHYRPQTEGDIQRFHCREWAWIYSPRPKPKPNYRPGSIPRITTGPTPPSAAHPSAGSTTCLDITPGRGLPSDKRLLGSGGSRHALRTRSSDQAIKRSILFVASFKSALRTRTAPRSQRSVHSGHDFRTGRMRMFGSATRLSNGPRLRR